MQVCIPSGVQRWVQKWLLVRGFCSARNPKISVLFCLPATVQTGIAVHNGQVVPVLHVF